RASRRAPRDADASPFPMDETTPPVTNINFVFISFHLLSLKFSEFFYDCDQISRGIDTYRIMSSFDDLDPVTVLQDAELLEFFGKFQIGRRHLRKLEQELPTVDVKPDMLVTEELSGRELLILQVVPFVTEIRHRGTGEIKRITLPVGNDLHNVRAQKIMKRLDPRFERRHHYGTVTHQRFDRFVDHGRLDQRLVTLDIDDDVAVDPAGDFGQPVGPGLVTGRGHLHPAAEFPHNGSYPLVIGGHDHI